MLLISCLDAVLAVRLLDLYVILSVGMLCWQLDFLLFMMSKYCTVEFDGSSKGNPGVGGAGAVIRNSNGDVIFRGNKPLGYTTNNAAEYEGLIMGLEKAREMGYTDVRARGDSKLVCEQLTGNWEVRSSNLYEPYGRAHDLISPLDNFEISHVPREYNTEADAEANKAAYSRGGKAFKEY